MCWTSQFERESISVRSFSCGHKRSTSLRHSITSTTDFPHANSTSRIALPPRCDLASQAGSDAMREIKVEGGIEQQPAAAMAIRQQTPISIVSSIAASPAADGATHATTTATTAATTPDGDVEMTNGCTAATGALENVGSRSRDLIQVIQRLSLLGINATLPSLPKFVVVGDQSAGKSSIIEATCDITLPRSEGTCTKCPFQITTTAQQDHADSWKCTVSILRKYTYGTHYVAGMHGAEFNRWRADADTTSLLFAVIHDKAELESTLRRAQLAVLNPDKDFNIFKDPAVAAPIKDTVGFSPNVISLKIEAPNLPELSFYDLPGAINSVPDESDAHLVDFIEKLLEIYVRDQKALILLACASNQDVETSTSLRFLRKWSATRRAMGVLTKPDLVDLTSARLTNFERILQGKDFTLGHGWFITRQLSQKQLNQACRITHNQARQQEAAFFAEEPWVAGGLAPHAHRFGISNLQDAISTQLTKHILAELPEIRARVEARRNDVEDALGQFPKKAEAPALSVYIEYKNVQEAVQKQIDPESKADFRVEYQRLLKAYSTRIRASLPTIDFTTPGYEAPVQEIDSSSEQETPSKKRQRTATPSRSIAAGPSKITPDSRNRRTPQVTYDAPRTGKRETFNLQDVHEKFESAPSTVFGETNSEVSKVYAVLAVQKVLPKITNTLIQQIEKLFGTMLTATVENVLCSRQPTQFFARVMEITGVLLQQLVEKRSAFIQELVDAECSRTVTLNRQATERRSYWEHELRKRCAAIRVREHFETLNAENNGKKIISVPDQEKKATDLEWVHNNLGADPYDREVVGLALPFAYYEIATAAFVDVVIKQLDFGLVARYHSMLPDALKTGLAGDDQYCAQLLAEDPQRERDRLRLLAEHGKLNDALNELRGLSDGPA
ncbi:Interferon-induced GTP-binding protein Mx [Pseudocercospora fuligena]|uniref:Interferon-induced GTP-binding protein Mx n=1 Tax=Pseudocercospora fuligena TaxID=685502 RepID=A0A8H6VMF8_9PEZI|nr:Interferon-induced GTP-binding protein Mx [Pseudocercospora fuligena]